MIRYRKNVPSSFELVKIALQLFTLASSDISYLYSTEENGSEVWHYTYKNEAGKVTTLILIGFFVPIFYKAAIWQSTVVRAVSRSAIFV